MDKVNRLMSVEGMSPAQRTVRANAIEKALSEVHAIERELLKRYPRRDWPTKEERTMNYHTAITRSRAGHWRVTLTSRKVVGARVQSEPLDSVHSARQELSRLAAALVLEEIKTLALRARYLETQYAHTH